jgi:hypothetical protein
MSPPLSCVEEMLGTPMAEAVPTLTPSSSKVGLGTLTSEDEATPALPSAMTLKLPWVPTLRTGSSHTGLYRNKFSVLSPKRKSLNC